MKYHISHWSALLALAFLLSPSLVYSSPLTPYTGNIHAGFTLVDTSDQQHSLSDYKGRVVLINFWASWCPPCIYEMPELQALKAHFSGRPFDILAINVGEKKYKVRKFSKVIKLELPVLLDTDSNTFKHWGVKTLPTSFLIDRNGKIRYRTRGNPGWQDDEVLQAIENLIREP